ncbi:MAG: hypothetical protein P4L84_17125 [Isosphaeraceae bacterium]|nr:hypothetical protein [Isosphaeraceae bacterium]
MARFACVGLLFAVLTGGLIGCGGGVEEGSPKPGEIVPTPAQPGMDEMKNKMSKKK